MRPLRVLLLAVGLLPAAGLLALTGYGFLAPNTWTVQASTSTDVAADVVIDQLEDVRRWPDWLFIGEVGGSDFVSVRHDGPQSGPGATTGWMRGFDMGEAELVSEVAGGGSYVMGFEERRAARVDEDQRSALSPGTDAPPWVETSGEIMVGTTGGQTELVLAEQGNGGPRPLGPFLLPYVQQRRQELAAKRLQALVEVAAAREARQILLPQ